MHRVMCILLSCRSSSRPKSVRFAPLPGTWTPLLVRRAEARLPRRVSSGRLPEHRDRSRCRSGWISRDPQGTPPVASGPFKLSLARRSSVGLASFRVGLPHPLAVACACRSSFRPGLAWVPIPSEVSPHPRYRTLSGRVVLLAVSHLAMPRLRGFQPPLRRAPILR